MNTTICQLQQQLAQKKISSVELITQYLQYLTQHNATYNAFISITKELALAQAKQADQHIARGNHGPLTGIPIAHKDIFCIKNTKTSCGSKMLDNFIAPYDATVVQQLQNAGMVTIGKTNMDEFAMGSSNENSYYGNVANPWDHQLVPGGSSGGSAAAVAARLVPVATATDTGGSIRQPAAFCGITGLKPSYGLVSRYGMVAFASSLDQAGPMALTAQDCALVLNAMAGYDERDSTSINHPRQDYSAQLNAPLTGLKVGIPKEYFDEHLDQNIAAKIQVAMKVLENLGATIIDISLPHTHYAVAAYYIIAPAECSSNLARFDGVRYGYRCDNPKDLMDLYCRSRGEGFGMEVKRRVMIGTYALSVGYYDAYYVKAQKIRTIISDEFNQAFQKVDVILGPTTPNLPFAKGAKTKDPMAMYLSDVFTIAANLAGLPALSMPIGFINQLPVGMQLIGKYFDEARILNIAHQYQQQTDWHKQSPVATVQPF